MTTRVLLKDVKDGAGKVKWPAGSVLDLHPNVWASICDQLGCTLGDLSAPASDASPTETAARIQELEEKIAELEADLADARASAKPAPKAAKKAAAKKG